MHLRRGLGQRLNEFHGVRPVAVVAKSVDEERRSAIHATSDPTPKVFANLSGISPRCQLARHALGVDADPCRVQDEILVFQSVLVAEENVVHLPEPALGPGCL